MRNVIVSTSEVAGKILKRGRLARRTTLLPLDKMKTRCLSREELKAAERAVGRGNVFRAIDLIDYDPELDKAMEFIFGGAFVCTDVEVANKLIFKACVGHLAVTLEGDKVNRSGELSGGAPSSGGSTLTQIAALREERGRLEEAKERLAEVEARLREAGPKARRHKQLTNQLEMRSRELEGVRERLSHTEHHRVAQEVQELKEQLVKLKEESEAARATEAEASKKVKELEYKIKNAKQLKEKELKEAEAAVKKAKKELEASKKQWADKESEEATLKLELKELKKSIDEAQEQIKSCEEAVLGYEEKKAELVAKLEEARAEVAEAKAAVQKQKEMVAQNNKEINAEAAKAAKISKACEDKRLRIQELGHKIAKAKEDAKEAGKQVAHMLEKYEWISVDRKFFGESGSAYDFKATDPKEAAKRIAKLEENKEKLEGNVNMRAMTMLDKAEVQYNDLMRKKATVETDKAKIKKVIEELDRKKRLEIRAAWDKVNKDFGSIFSTLLPGTQAKLQPPDGMDVLDGLEVKVAFGDVWKESLSELSGGQRSLVALSLILSLLLFKPAPLYILDEVDAALDLSHTQNIGHMLKTHFQHSQVLKGSLKCFEIFLIIVFSSSSLWCR